MLLKKVIRAARPSVKRRKKLYPKLRSKSQVSHKKMAFRGFNVQQGEFGSKRMEC